MLLELLTALTLHQAQELAVQSYPQTKQKVLIVRTEEYSVANAMTAYLPQANFHAQATYQNEVTAVPVTIPAFAVEELSKDQYRFQIDFRQNVFDGSVASNQADIARSKAEVDQRSLEVDLYKLRDRVTQVYLGLLLLREQEKQIRARREALRGTITAMSAGVREGAILPTIQYQLEAEDLSAQQTEIKIKSSERAYEQMVSLLVNAQVDSTTSIGYPDTVSVLTDVISRPELQLFSAQHQNIESRSGLVSAGTIPHIYLYGTIGYGKPGYDFLKNEFRPYALAGLGLDWKFSEWWTNSSTLDNLAVEHEQVRVSEDLFQYHTRLTMAQQSADVVALKKLIDVDNLIIDRRQRIMEISRAAMFNGTLTAHEFIQDETAFDSAKRDRLQRIVQLHLAIQSYLITVGRQP